MTFCFCLSLLALTASQHLRLRTAINRRMEIFRLFICWRKSHQSCCSAVHILYLLQAACIIYFRPKRGDRTQWQFHHTVFVWEKNKYKSTYLFDTYLTVSSVLFTTAFVLFFCKVQTANSFRGSKESCGLHCLHIYLCVQATVYLSLPLASPSHILFTHTRRSVLWDLGYFLATFKSKNNKCWQVLLIL